MSTSFAQTTIYFPPNSNDDLVPINFSGNVSGLGISQCIGLINSAVVLPANSVVGITFQVSRPPPLLYFSTQNAADKILIQSPDGLVISPSTFAASVGFNGIYFQPSAGGVYLLYFTSGVLRGPSDPCGSIQAVLENTVGQYIDMGSVTYTVATEKLSVVPQVSQIIAANTTSAVPNTFVIDFTKYPVTKGLNVLCTYRVMVSAAGMEQFGKDFLNTVGANAKTVTIVAGQAMAVQWYSTENGFLNARYSLTISGAGQLALPATVGMTAIPSMYPAMLGNQANITSYTDMAVEKSQGPSLDMDLMGSIFTNKLHSVHDEINRLSEKNERAHEMILNKIKSLAEHIANSEAEDRRDSDKLSVLSHMR